MAELDLGKVVGRDGTIVKRNLLDNSDFRNPINQRGQSSYTANGYTIDRWSIWGANNDASLTVNDGHITFSPGTGGGTLTQRLPKGTLDSNKAYTVAHKTTDGIVHISGNDSITFAYEDSCDRVTITSDAQNIVWAALYEGEYTADTLPEYIPKGYAAELMECQRYYQQCSVVGLTCRNNGYASTLLPMTMRVAPTVSIGARRLYTTSYEDVSGTYPNTLGANTTSIFFNNSFYEGFVTITCNDVSLSADL